MSMTRKEILKGGVLTLLVFVVAFVAVSALVTLLRHGFSARDNPSWIETIVARTARRVAAPPKARSMTNPIPNTPENLARARAHWADHCATCHANNGSGDTDIGRNLYPKAPDMRLPATQNLSDGEIYYTINNGIRLTGMPAWGKAGENDEDSWRLVHFIRHLPRLAPEEEQEMKKMNPKSPEEFKEEQEEEQFLNEGQPSDQRHEPAHKNH
jgi:mono/diheme cytochrome c family protein